jgi:hypothetical protein
MILMFIKLVVQRRWSDSLGEPPMWTLKNRSSYNRDHLRYPSDLSYRRILVMEEIRRQRLELAI